MRSKVLNANGEAPGRAGAYFSPRSALKYAKNMHNMQKTGTKYAEYVKQICKEYANV